MQHHLLRLTLKVTQINPYFVSSSSRIALIGTGYHGRLSKYIFTHKMDPISLTRPYKAKSWSFTPLSDAKREANRSTSGAGKSFCMATGNAIVILWA